VNFPKVNKPTIINWSFFILINLSFSVWNGYFSKALSQEEINHYSAILHEKNPEISLNDYKEILSNDKGEPIYMVNVIKYFDHTSATNLKDKNSDSKKVAKPYRDYVGKFLIQRGSYPIFIGKASGGTAASWGVSKDDSQGWSEAVIVRYKNIRTLLQMASNSTFQKKFTYKVAALEKTIAYPTDAKLIMGGLFVNVLFCSLSISLLFQLIINKKRIRSNFKTY
jgi:hypothetical protein